MKSSRALVVLALLSIVLAGVLPDSTLQILSHAPNPNSIFEQVSFNPLSYADPEVIVALAEIKISWNGVALSQFLSLYPQYKPSSIQSCKYSTLGLTRFYTFTVSVGSATKDVTTAIQVKSSSEDSNSTSQERDGYSQVSAEWAQQDPEISFALNSVIKQNWETIQGHPLEECWAKPAHGVWSFRFSFSNVTGWFEYSSSESNSTEKNGTEYYTDIQPVFVVGDASEYAHFDLSAFKKDPSYPEVASQLNQTLGSFDPSWILNVSISISGGIKYIKLTINFKPFLLKQNYEAQYYGSVQKAALLKIDEAVFNADGQSYQNWQQIKNFSSFNAFREAREYVLYQFTWLRFYEVVSAYSALHLKGRYVRLVFKGLGQYLDPKNQINIVIFIDECGRYFIDRNDFLATNLDSYGRTNWVSLFVETPSVTKAQYYQDIVHFFESIYPKFWSVNQLVDIKFKGNLHVVKFQNPTHTSVGCLSIDKTQIQILNNFNWIALSDNSPLTGRIQNYVKGKYEVSSLMFIQYLPTDNGTHFQVGYLDKSQTFHTAYVLYIPATDVFTDDYNYAENSKNFVPSTYINPLPKDVNGSIVKFLQAYDNSLTAILSYVSLSPYSFAVIAISNGSRWQYIINWNKAWAVASKQPYADGYFTTSGVPSASAASCAGFLSKLFPKQFTSSFVYVSVETKSVGINLYNRIVFFFGVTAYEGVVSTTFGIQSSQVLQHWAPVLYIKPSTDYGYGKDCNINYGVDPSYLYSQPTSSSTSTPSGSNLSTQREAASTACPEGKALIFGLCLPNF